MRRARGLMLVEVLVVIAIMALISTVVAFGVVHLFLRAKIDAAALSTSSLRRVAGAYRLNHLGDECPTYAQLRTEKMLDRESKPNDPWGSPYAISCTDDDVTVTSAGPDKRIGTEDDIVAPADAAVAKSP